MSKGTVNTSTVKPSTLASKAIPSIETETESAEIKTTKAVPSVLAKSLKPKIGR